MNFLSLIEAKREGHALPPEKIRAFVSDYVNGQIPDYQMAALLMAIYFRGMTTPETTALTLAMRDSGETLSFPKDPRPLVDKHSTGGVGDKISLPLAPLLASLDFRVPMISGRGLGITGGTLDKLESIPGFKTSLSFRQIIAQVQSVGSVICGQTDRMVPADKKLYALRDVTGTVPSIPLIVASIMSKKLAENLDALILDVKFGAAAFMQTKDQARNLAQAMVALGNECGVNTRALITEMNAPLGRAAGNWLEVKESVACLDPVPSTGDGNDLHEIIVNCAAALLDQTKASSGPAIVEERLRSGAARRKWDEMLLAQGADMEAFHRKLSLDHTAPVVREFVATATRLVQTCDARVIGEIVRDLGGGRVTKESVIHHDVGIDQLAKPGEARKTGEVLARVHAANEKDADAALARLKSAFRFCDEPVPAPGLIHEVIQ